MSWKWRAVRPPFSAIDFNADIGAAKVEWKVPVNDNCGHRLAPAAQQALDDPLLAEIHEFNFVTVGVQSVCNLPLALDHIRAASVIKVAGVFIVDSPKI